MTRKDYVRIAAALTKVRSGYRPNCRGNLFRALNDTARELADELAADNPRFDRERFLAACDVPQE